MKFTMNTHFAENLSELMQNKNTSKGSWFIAIKCVLNKLVCLSQKRLSQSEVKNTQHLPKASIVRLFFL
jgi:hypothetical protein